MSTTSTTTTTTSHVNPRRRRTSLKPTTHSEPVVSSGSSTSGVEAKVVVMGSAGVGKTSLVQRYTTNRFNSTKIAATAGAGFHVKKTVVDGVPIRLQLWDTAGQERFRSLAPMYYRGAHAAVLVYDITNPASFEDVKAWLEELKKNLPTDAEENMVIYIVGAKADLAPRQRRITPEKVRSTLASWFPPPKLPRQPQASTSSALAPYYAPGYPFTSSSAIYPSSHFGIPSQLSSLSTSVSTHLSTLPSFNLGLPNLRPRFTSLTSSSSKPSFAPAVPARQGESPTGTDSTVNTASSGAVSGGTSNTSTSGFHQPPAPNSLMPPPAPSTGSRFMTRSITTSAVPQVSGIGLNVNMTGSGYSSFGAMGEGLGYNAPSSSKDTGVEPRQRRMSGPALVEFPSSPSLVRRKTDVVPSAGLRSRNANAAKLTRLSACLSDDEDNIHRGRDRQRPAAYRRFNEVENVRLFAEGRRDSSSGDEMDCWNEFRPGGPGAVRVRKETERRKREEEERRRKAVEQAAAAVARDQDDDDAGWGQPWGFSKELELREVSAKDGQGVEELFASLSRAIIRRRDVIERERKLRERDSIMLNVPTTVPTWGTLPEEDDSPSGDPSRRTGYGWGSCCSV